MNRKLVTIVQVDDVLDIEGADKIQLAKVKGWQVVIKKNTLRKNDFGVFFEIDSFLPVQDRYAFLPHKKIDADGIEGYRLKTARFRGALSQGLLLPLTEFPEINNPTEGDDVSALIGVKKFEMPIPAHLAGLVKGAFPAYIHKTDQERIQNLPDYFTTHKDVSFEVTEKVDGTSCTYYLRDGEFGVCSRNLELKESEGNTYWKVARDLDIENKLRSRNPTMNIALQGEICGEGVNGNRLKLKGHHYLVYDIWDIDGSRYISPLGTQSLCKVMGLEHVPLVDTEQKTFQTYDTMEKLLNYASGVSKLTPEVQREGLVFKATATQNCTFKVVSNDYLLKEKD